jgi:hypothetical protein
VLTSFVEYIPFAHLSHQVGVHSIFIVTTNEDASHLSLHVIYRCCHYLPRNWLCSLPFYLVYSMLFDSLDQACYCLIIDADMSECSLPFYLCFWTWLKHAYVLTYQYLSYFADAYDDFYVFINMSFVSILMIWYHSMNDKIWATPRPLPPSLRAIAFSLSLMMASSEPIATMVTFLNHAASYLKTQSPMELLNTLMILFLLTEALGT